MIDDDLITEEMTEEMILDAMIAGEIQEEMIVEVIIEEMNAGMTEMIPKMIIEVIVEGMILDVMIAGEMISEEMILVIKIADETTQRGMIDETIQDSIPEWMLHFHLQRSKKLWTSLQHQSMTQIVVYRHLFNWLDKSADTIYISNLPQTVTEQSLAEFFGSVGIIKKDKRTLGPKVWIYRDKVSGMIKGDATVTYADPSAADGAINWFDGKPFEGSILKVEKARALAPPPGGWNAKRGGRGGYRGGRF
ncbi:hypothetical protein BC833DRAFT_594077 [Globomyces pollinis-pini]|nr:hypothetical protein BC833DRAFT_594077 [Globomyces pollinis-pini]